MKLQALQNNLFYEQRIYLLNDIFSATNGLFAYEGNLINVDIQVAEMYWYQLNRQDKILI